MTEPTSGPSNSRPFLGTLMKCCNVYIRAYINAERSAFVGRCPRCTAAVRIPIVSQGGSASRFFEAS